MDLMSWVTVCCCAAIAGCIAGVGLGVAMTSRLREQVRHDGYVDGVQRFATGIRQAAPRKRDERFEDCYLLPVNGLERLEIELCRPDRRKEHRRGNYVTVKERQ